MNEHILFSDESPLFRSPAEPKAGDQVTIRFRTAAGDAEAVFFVRGEERIQMARSARRSTPSFDFYETHLQLGKETVHYHFEVLRGGEVWQINRQGPVWVCEPQDDFCIIPGFSTPDWAKGAVFYQIFVDRFANGDETNDPRDGEVEYLGAPVRKKAWTDPVTEPDVGVFYGGDLSGVIDKLDYLADLGVEGIYFNPIFVSPSSHKYDTQDYDHVDPHFGIIVRDGDYCTRTTDPENLAASDALLAKLIREAHKRGIRVILDGVFNHCGSFHKWLDREGIYREAAARAAAEGTGAPQAEPGTPQGEPGGTEGAFHSAESPYRTFFRFADEQAWPDNDSYEGWWDHATLPKLNYEGSDKLQDEILRIATKWISPPYRADGWRLDVAADLGHSPETNHAFWRRFREAVKMTRPDALILAEHYGYAGDWLGGDQWDSVMNIDAFMEPISWFLTGMEKHSEHAVPELAGDGTAFCETVRRAGTAFGTGQLLVAMNELDNHDHSRFLTRTAHVAGRLADLGAEAASEQADRCVLRQAVVMQMTWPGMPTLYYGDEAGLAGFTDPDNRRPYPWGFEDADLLAFYRAAIALHKSGAVFRTGSLIPLPCFAPVPAGEECGREVPGVLAYGRFNKKEAALVVVHAGEEPVEVAIPVAPLGVETEDARENGTADRTGTADGKMSDATSEPHFTHRFHTGRDGWEEQSGAVPARDGLLQWTLSPGDAEVFVYGIIRP